MLRKRSLSRKRIRC